jgi:HK97 family phage major capsid protein
MTLIQINSFLDPSGVVIHPTDWQDIRLLRTTDGIYIWGSPADTGPERIWGLPVVKTTAATLNTAIVAAFDTAMQIFRRNEVSFAISDSHNDFCIKHQLMLRVEERLAFPVYRPQAICLVTGI